MMYISSLSEDFQAPNKKDEFFDVTPQGKAKVSLTIAIPVSDFS